MDAGSRDGATSPDFKQRIIDRSKTRVLALLNIVGNGMRGDKFEHNLEDMEAKPQQTWHCKTRTLSSVSRPRTIVEPEWTPVEHAEQAGRTAKIPVMVDFGDRSRRTSLYKSLLTK